MVWKSLCSLLSAHADIQQRNHFTPDILCWIFIIISPKTKQSYLEVFKGDPPLIGWVFGCARHEQRPLEVGDGLAAVRVLGGSVNVPAAVKRGFGTVVLQLHGVQREPAPCRHLVIPLTQSKAEKHQRAEHQISLTAKQEVFKSAAGLINVKV